MKPGTFIAFQSREKLQRLDCLKCLPKRRSELTDSSSMATFVSLVTCHHCPFTSTRRGLIYGDSLSALPRNLRAPGFPCRSLGPWALHTRRHCRLARADLPESIALARSKPSGSMKHLVLTHLRRMLTPSPAQQQKGLHLPG